MKTLSKSATKAIEALAQKLTPQFENYASPTVLSTDGRKLVRFLKNGDSVIAIACFADQFDSETMSDDSYWFTVGTYKTLENAIKAAVRRLERHNVTLAIA